MARRSLVDSIRLAQRRKDLILTPRVVEYLARHRDGLFFSEETAERIKSLMVTRPRNRRGSFSPSSAGYCLRRQVFDFLGKPGKKVHTLEEQLIFADGTWRHLRYQAMGIEDGWFTDIEVSAAMHGTMFKGSMDGANDDEGWFFELKGTSATERQIRNNVFELADRLNAGEDPDAFELNPQVPVEATFIKNWKQVQRYFFQTGDRFKMAVLMYEPKSYQSPVEIDLAPTPIGQVIAEQEMAKLESAVTDKRLPAPLHECRGRNSNTRKNCPYGRDCLLVLTWDEAKPRTIKRKKRS